MVNEEKEAVSSDTTEQLLMWAHSSHGSVHEPTKLKLGQIPGWTGEVDMKSISVEELLATESYWEREGQFSLRVLPPGVGQAPVEDHTFKNVWAAQAGLDG